jgi:competence transcription factor ComK
MVKESVMGMMNEMSQAQKEMEMMADFARMEIKMKIMQIMFSQPTPEAKVAAITDYILKESNETRPMD